MLPNSPTEKQVHPYSYTLGMSSEIFSAALVDSCNYFPTPEGDTHRGSAQGNQATSFSVLHIISHSAWNYSRKL
jgi:hypothetical protein